MTIGTVIGPVSIGTCKDVGRSRVAMVTRIASIATGPAEVFVGRAPQVDQVLAALAPGSGTAGTGPVVVSAVAGMGGIGKTALARHCAAVAVQRSWFPGGAFLVDLQGYSPDGQIDAGQVFASLLRQLGLPGDQVPVDAGEQAAVYNQTLTALAEQGQRVVVVLDNISSTTATIHGLLPAAGPHRVVVTTRDTLDLPGARHLSLDVLGLDEAVALLDQAVRERQPNNLRIAKDHDAAARLAQACGRLPLALRIVAGLLTDDPILTAGELAVELADSPIEAFTHGESAIAAVFDLSWNRLLARDPDAASVLRLLVLDPGPDISTSAAAALADLPLSQVRTRLRTLRQAHLLNLVNGRWRLHDLVRRYLHDRTAPDITAEYSNAATTRLVDHYTVTSEAANDHLDAVVGSPVPDRFTDRVDALHWLDTERANLVAVTALAANTGRHSHTARLAAALTYFMMWRRHVTDMVTIAQHECAAASHLDNPTILGYAWTHLGIALGDAGRLDEAISANQRVLAIFQQASDPTGEGTAWVNLGVTLHDAKRFDEAITAHETARDIHQRNNHRRGEEKTWINLGKTLHELERFDEAIAAHQRALEICHQTGDRPDEVAAWHNLALAFHQVRRFDEAITAHHKGLEICQEIDDRHSERRISSDLGQALHAAGRIDQAITAHHHALEISQQVDDRHSEGVAWDYLGRTLQAAGRDDEARRCWGEAIDAYIETGDFERADNTRRTLTTLDQ